MEMKNYNQLPVAGFVDVSIFNMLGQKVTTLINVEQPAGIHRVTWDGKNSFDQEVASGLYFYRIRAGNNVVTKKCLLLR